MGLILRGLILLPLLFSAQIAYSQVDPFNTPWILVGDSLKFEPKKIVILTGHITELNSNEAVQGASVSVDMYKHFDHTDAQGNYLLLLEHLHKFKFTEKTGFFYTGKQLPLHPLSRMWRNW